MARKVLSWSLRFCITPKSSLKFAEIRYVSLGSLRFVKVHQKFAKVLQELSSFSEGLQGSARLYEVLRRISKTRTCSAKFCRLQEASIGFINVLFTMKFYQVPQGSTRFHQVPQWSSGFDRNFHWAPTWFHWRGL